MRKKRLLLVVDDDPQIRVQLGWALREEFDVRLAANSGEAARFLDREAPPAAALVDLHLPPDEATIESGLWLIRALKDRSAETRIIAISSCTNEDSRRRSCSAGAEILLNKPVRTTELLELLG